MKILGQSGYSACCRMTQSSGVTREYSQLCKQRMKFFLMLCLTYQVVGDGGVRVGDGDEDPAGRGFLVVFGKFRGEER